MTRQLLILVAVAAALAPAMAKDQVYGVSLGGHLVPEPFIDAVFWNKLNESCPLVKDIYSVCECTIANSTAAENVKALFKDHLDNWVDLEELRSVIETTGINTLRYPISYTYFLDEQDPFDFYKYGTCGVLQDALTSSSFKDVLTLMDELDVDVILDLHQAIGCQNGYDNGGHFGVVDFYTMTNANKTIQIWKNIVKYLDDQGLKDLIWGFEPINEPTPFYGSDQESILQYYTESVVNDVLVPWISDDQMIILQPGPGNSQVQNYINYTLNIADDRVNMDYHEYVVFEYYNLQPVSYFFDQVIATASTTYGNTKFKYFVGEWSAATTDCAQYLNGAYGAFSPDYYQNHELTYPNFNCNQIDQVRDNDTVGFQTCSGISRLDETYPYCKLTDEWDTTFLAYKENMCQLFETWNTGFGQGAGNIGYIFWTLFTGENGEREIQQWDFRWLVDNGIVSNLTNLQNCTASFQSPELVIE